MILLIYGISLFRNSFDIFIKISVQSSIIQIYRYCTIRI
nr:MAG TPA: hypothetical protein [Bacteriophage sp.]